jgi:hypothetical protein
MFITSMPDRMTRTHRKSLKPIMGLMIRLMARWSWFDNVVQVLDLTDLDGRFPFSVDALDGGQIGAAFVDGNGLGHAVLIHGFLEVTTGGSLVTMGPKQEIDGLSSPLSTARYKYFHWPRTLT